MNRWQYTNPEKGLISFLNLRFLDDNKQSGQLAYDPKVHKFGHSVWGSEVDTRRIEFSGKVGYVNPEITYQILGRRVSYSSQNHGSYCRNRRDAIDHKRDVASVIYN